MGLRGDSVRANEIVMRLLVIDKPELIAIKDNNIKYIKGDRKSVV